MTRARDIHARFIQIEAALAESTYFAGDSFCVVDAAFVPVFCCCNVFDSVGDFGFLTGLPKVRRWRQALGARPSVVNGMRADYAERLGKFLLARGSALSGRMSPSTNTRPG